MLTIVGGKVVHATDEFSNHNPPALPVLPEWSPIKAFGGYGAPLDVRKAARAGVPMPRPAHHTCHHHHSHATPDRFAGFWGLGCDCFAF